MSHSFVCKDADRPHDVSEHLSHHQPAAMAAAAVASMTGVARPSLRIQHKQPARQSVASRAVVRPVAQQTQQNQQQRKVLLRAAAIEGRLCPVRWSCFVVTVASPQWRSKGEHGGTGSRIMQTAANGSFVLLACPLNTVDIPLQHVAPTDAHDVPFLQAALAAGVSALSVALAPAAMAAQEAMMVAEVIPVEWRAASCKWRGSTDRR